MKRTRMIAAVAVLFGLCLAYFFRHQIHALRVRILGRREKPKPVFVENIGPTQDIMLLLCDHFEPVWSGKDVLQFRTFLDGYRRMAGRFRDTDGCPPKITFFVIQSVDPGILEMMLPFVREGFGELELQIHHGTDDDTGRDNTDEMKRIIREVRGKYRRFGYCHYPASASENFSFGFVHGNWALDNSRVNEKKKRAFCGINLELNLLKELGCYADFTFPGWGTMTPTKVLDRHFYAKDDNKPKSYDIKSNIQVMRVGGKSAGDLLLLQGPDSNDAWNIYTPPDIERMKEWVAHQVRVEGQDRWVFIKLYTHSVMDWWKGGGINPEAEDVFYGARADKFYQDILDFFKPGKYRLHFVSAREFYNIAKAAEAGKTGNAGAFRDFALPKPLCFSRDNSE